MSVCRRHVSGMKAEILLQTLQALKANKAIIQWVTQYIQTGQFIWNEETTQNPQTIPSHWATNEDSAASPLSPSLFDTSFPPKERNRILRPLSRISILSTTLLMEVRVRLCFLIPWGLYPCKNSTEKWQEEPHYLPRDRWWIGKEGTREGV